MAVYEFAKNVSGGEVSAAIIAQIPDAGVYVNTAPGLCQVHTTRDLTQAEQDTVAGIVAAAVDPDTLTRKQKLRQRLLARLDAMDEETTALLKAAARELYELDVTLGQAFMALRSRVMTGSGAVPPLAPVTWQDFVQRIRDRLTNDLED